MDLLQHLAPIRTLLFFSKQILPCSSAPDTPGSPSIPHLSTRSQPGISPLARPRPDSSTCAQFSSGRKSLTIKQQIVDRGRNEGVVTAEIHANPRRMLLGPHPGQHEVPPSEARPPAGRPDQAGEHGGGGGERAAGEGRGEQGQGQVVVCVENKIRSTKKLTWSGAHRLTIECEVLGVLVPRVGLPPPDPPPDPGALLR